MKRRIWNRRRLVVAVLGIIALVAGTAFWNCVPDPLFTEPGSSVLIDRDGGLMGARIAADGQWRFPGHPVVAERFAQALLTYEDRRFFHHPGVDPLAIARAAYTNLKSGEVVSGGSTISMQVVRLARGNRARTYREKVVEMIWALRLELGRDKSEVLALYAAHAPFGGNVVGLEAAAWRYFGRSPDGLSWAEAATLAVLPNSPALIHPGRNRSLLEEKRNALLARLHDRGVIDGTQLRLALLEPLPESPRTLPQDAPHLLETLIARDGGENRFESTLSAELQRILRGIVTRGSRQLTATGIDNLAAIVVDNRSFEVLAYVGNSDWSVTEGSGFAIDLIQRPRSTGSILKPLLFAAMLDAGEILPQTLIPDLPTQYDGYMPENYDGTFRGAVPAAAALARSLNVPAVRMLRAHGVDRFYDYLQQLGMSTLHRPPRDYGLTLILGGAEGTLWDITSMYANLANIGNGGSLAPEPVYRRATMLRGESTATDRRADLSVGAAWLTLEALVEVVRPGSDAQWRSFDNAERIAWKTGTSYGRRDAWAVGSSSHYTVGVWAGNASGEGRPELTGVGAAAPVLFDIFSRLEPAEPFLRPDYAVRAVSVCHDDGYLATSGCQSDTAWAPVDSHFERPSPHHRVVHLDPTESWRVDSSCESIDSMVHRTWFVLPPGQEWYYRRHHSGYRMLPPYRSDCAAYAATTEHELGPIEFIYPGEGTRVYIPVDLSGEKGRVVFEAAHREPGATLFWHVDDRFLGSTRTFHELALDIERGEHTLVVVDGHGNSLRRRFEVLARGGGD